jgi:hypothetical protein
VRRSTRQGKLTFTNAPLHLDGAYLAYERLRAFELARYRSRKSDLANIPIFTGENVYARVSAKSAFDRSGYHRSGIRAARMLACGLAVLALKR